MKVISLWQPWASLIAAGAKTWETRSWPTRYRGALAIHATKSVNRQVLDFLESQDSQALREAMIDRGLYLDALPLGCIVAVCRLTDCIECVAGEPAPKGQEALGDFSPGRFAWKLEAVKSLMTPVPFTGSQGLKDAPEWLAQILTPHLTQREDMPWR